MLLERVTKLSDKGRYETRTVTQQSEWNSHAEPQTLHQSSNQQILLQWNGREGRVILMGRVYVWSGLLPLINWILNELSDDLMFFIRVLMYLARSSYCLSLIPESQQILITDICHWTPYILVLSTPSWLCTFFNHIFFPFSRFVCVEQTLFSHTFLQLQSNSCHRNEARGWTLPLILTLCEEKHYLLSQLYSIISIGLRPQPQPLTFKIYQLLCISGYALQIQVFFIFYWDLIVYMMNNIF